MERIEKFSDIKAGDEVLLKYKHGPVVVSYADGEIIVCRMSYGTFYVVEPIDFQVGDIYRTGSNMEIHPGAASVAKSYKNNSLIDTGILVQSGGPSEWWKKLNPDPQ